MDFREQLQKAQGIAQKNLSQCQERQKQCYDAQSTKRELKVGDWVVVLLPDNSNKILSQWHGPFQVMKHMGPVNYEVL